MKPAGDSRPGWKVLRILGSMMEIPHFHPDTLEAVRQQIAPDLHAWAKAGLDNSIATFSYELRAPGSGLERIAEFAVTASDPIVRRSPALQKTADGKASRAARLNAATLAKLGLAAGDTVRVKQGDGEATLKVALDAALPDNTVRVARGVIETAALGEGAIALEKIRETVAA